ncbi:acetate--CoA ligase family protein [Pseudorhodoferax sp.]|uniref:acetate--CoA ligase family protein n=1 Tax=Pseudorhodoferax sp. TaxID=1993553 RepID=UPI002DD68612|nr:acetate--CoA ligase family protein [Pseudorhodoferax sp.]
MPLDPRAALRHALAPRSIAVIGASDNAHKIGGRPIAYLSRFGFQGPVYPINPTRPEVQGLRTYADLQALPEVPDMAIIAVPGEAAVEAVQACAQAGVSVGIIMASGFGEVHAEGKRQEQAMRACARAAGMRLIGPNSQGLANFGNGAVPSFSTMFTEVAPADGPIGIISQSGAMAVVPYGLLRARGLGVRHSHATGNDCDVTVCELATVVAEDPALKLLLLYLEGIPDPWHLAEAAQIARERKLPIVVLKAGRTAAGQEAAQSHTGALASEDRTVDAFLREHGIMRAQSMAELVDSAPLYLQGWRPQGRRLVAISNSGAVCVLTADAATAADMPLAPLQEPTQAALREILPGFATVRNPVDITAALLSNSSLFSRILPPIARDPAADAFLIGIAVAGAGYDVDAFARDAAGFAGDTGKPLVVAAPQQPIAERFKQHGLAVYPTEGQAVQALGVYLTHMQLLQDTHARRPQAVQPVPAIDGVRLLDEAASLALLGGHGIAVVPHRLCADAAQAVEAFRQLGAARVVVKGCTADASHKTELGLVQLGIDSEQGVRDAFDRMQAAARAAGVGLRGVIVATQASGQRELMIGARLDPLFGPVVVVGDGGKYVEAMPDAQVLMAPFGPDQVARALRRLRIAPLLEGVRGEPPLDWPAFCAAAVAVGRLMADRQAGIVQLDINPVLVGAQGCGCVALDAVVYQGRVG